MSRIRAALRALVKLRANSRAVAECAARQASSSVSRFHHSPTGLSGGTRATSPGVASGTPPTAVARMGTPRASYSSAEMQKVSTNPWTTLVGKTPAADAARRHCAAS
jgi:hypothetical protein